MKKTITATIIILALIMQTSAVRVGVVVDNGETITQRCIGNIEDGSMADLVCDQTGFECTDFGGDLGKGICSIGGTGCPANNCFCESRFWGFSTKTSSDWQFSYSEGVSSVQVQDNMLLGFRFGEWGDTPRSNLTFCEICDCGSGGGEGGGKGKALDYYIAFDILGRLENTTRIRVHDKDNANMSLREAKIEVFSGTAGMTEVVLEAETGWDGTANLTLDKPKEYGLRITAHRHHQLYTTIKVEETTTTTTTTSTTTFKTTTTSTTETTLKHFLLQTTSTIESTATSEITSTSTTESTTTTSTTTTETTGTTEPQEPAITGNAVKAETTDNQKDYLPYEIALIIVSLPLIAWLRS